VPNRLGGAACGPRPGDRIRTLHKETERPKNVRGGVLVRGPGETAQADPS
jgi:hypothetical protein